MGTESLDPTVSTLRAGQSPSPLRSASSTNCCPKSSPLGFWLQLRTPRLQKVQSSRRLVNPRSWANRPATPCATLCKSSRLDVKWFALACFMIPSTGATAALHQGPFPLCLTLPETIPRRTERLRAATLSSEPSKTISLLFNLDASQPRPLFAPFVRMSVAREMKFNEGVHIFINKEGGFGHAPERLWRPVNLTSRNLRYPLSKLLIQQHGCRTHHCSA